MTDQPTSGSPPPDPNGERTALRPIVPPVKTPRSSQAASPNPTPSPRKRTGGFVEKELAGDLESRMHYEFPPNVERLPEEILMCILTYAYYSHELSIPRGLKRDALRISGIGYDIENLVKTNRTKFVHIHGLHLRPAKGSQPGGATPDWLGYYEAHGSWLSRNLDERRKGIRTDRRNYPPFEAERSHLPPNWLDSLGDNYNLNDWYMYPHTEKYLWFKNMKTGHYIHFSVTWRLSTPDGKDCLYYDKGSKIKDVWGQRFDGCDVKGQPTAKGSLAYDGTKRGGPSWHYPHDHSVPPMVGWKDWSVSVDDQAPDGMGSIEYQTSLLPSPKPAEEEKANASASKTATPERAHRGSLELQPPSTSSTAHPSALPTRPGSTQPAASACDTGQLTKSTTPLSPASKSAAHSHVSSLAPSRSASLDAAFQNCFGGEALAPSADKTQIVSNSNGNADATGLAGGSIRRVGSMASLHSIPETHEDETDAVAVETVESAP